MHNNNILDLIYLISLKTWRLHGESVRGRKPSQQPKETRLIYYDVTAIKVILSILVLLIRTYFFCYLEVGVDIFYVWLDCHFNFLIFL